jgi:hypothetical protein
MDRFLARISAGSGAVWSGKYRRLKRNEKGYWSLRGLSTEPARLEEPSHI